MHGTTHPQSMAGTTKNATTPGGERRSDAHTRHIVEVVIWICAFVALTTLAFFVHAHPKPYPIDISAIKTVQGLHLLIDPVLVFISSINDPLPSIIALVLWLVVLSLFRWFQQAIFIVLTVMGADGIEGLYNIIVGRPRPTPQYGIHVDTTIPFHSFPSGHTEHDVAYYGILLYLSFTKSVREWRYRWVLLPFQIFAAVAIISIGYSRLLEGEHWFTDVIGGYLSGLFSLLLFIFIYRWATDKLAQRRARKAAQKKGYQAAR